MDDLVTAASMVRLQVISIIMVYRGTGIHLAIGALSEAKNKPNS
jgi:hypothetical protein